MVTCTSISNKYTKQCDNMRHSCCHTKMQLRFASFSRIHQCLHVTVVNNQMYLQPNVCMYIFFVYIFL